VDLVFVMPAIDVNLDHVVKQLDAIVNDRGVPKNIRRACLESIEHLKNNKQAFEIRLNSAIGLLDEITNDPNIPMYTRTQIWNIVSMLEAAGKDQLA
jgi:uncharacterized protein